MELNHVHITRHICPNFRLPEKCKQVFIMAIAQRSVQLSVSINFSCGILHPIPIDHWNSAGPSQSDGGNSMLSVLNVLIMERGIWVSSMQSAGLWRSPDRFCAVHNDHLQCTTMSTTLANTFACLLFSMMKSSDKCSNCPETFKMMWIWAPESRV